ncbi:cation:proton antiporter [Acidocella aromatica]|uniref:CPA1 family monovalent cation:H+ antiporter n=1 Tax=Acidocella aromatica TaxID=1303579 RepID=A0A840VSH7_9PROT|nr:sodium:proton antiporter [Acidocella aromatica]MBB5374270.1 CPA1 family monovalent cation:H+ antiporter [Acidocella aromatica]
MDTLITSTLGLLLAAIAVALIARRLHLPYTVGLVLAGAVLAMARVHTGITLTHEIIYTLILPPLLFEAAINIHWRELRQDALPVLVLSIAGTLIAAATVSAGMVWGLGWPLPTAALFGALIAATDPVAVIAMFKDNNLTGRLRLLVESESLFNDGVAAVLFTLVLTWAQASGAPQSLPGVALSLGWTVAGGILIGLATAALVLGLAGRTTDHLVESTLTTVAAYGAFLFAQHLGCSGVLATVTAGLVIGNLGILAETDASRITPHGRQFVLALWEFIAFIANSLVFLLIGLAVGGMHITEPTEIGLLAVIALVLLSRALTVYPLCLCFARSRWAMPLPMQHVLWWGGLRGALGLALALSLPPALPYRDAILTATFAVVIFSVVGQGLTMPPLLRGLRLIPRR